MDWIRYPNPRKPKLPAVTPRDFNVWVTWVLYATYGRLQQADAIMRQAGDHVKQYAAYLRAKRPFGTKTLYRGLLLEPDEVVDGALRLDPAYSFISWTEKLDVACWFADRKSAISGEVARRRPKTLGYIGQLDRPSPSLVLFHWSWAKSFEVTPGRKRPLAALAAMHPEMAEGMEQIQWSMDTQKEVITTALPQDTLALSPKSDFSCPDTRSLDRKYWPPSVPPPSLLQMPGVKVVTLG